MLFTQAKLVETLGDAAVTAAALDPAHIKVKLYTGGPDPSPSNAYTDFTLAAGTNSKTLTSWTTRLSDNGATLTSPSISFVPGTDVNTGQTIKGLLLATDSGTPALIGSEKFPGDRQLNTSSDVLIVVVNVFLGLQVPIGNAEQV